MVPGRLSLHRLADARVRHSIEPRVVMTKGRNRTQHDKSSDRLLTVPGINAPCFLSLPLASHRDVDPASLQSFPSQRTPSLSSMADDSDEHQSMPSPGRDCHDCRMPRSVSMVRDTGRMQESTSRRPSVSPRQRCPSCSSEPRTPSSQGDLDDLLSRRVELMPSFDSSDTRSRLWPFPAGEPVLPVNLQAIPYPTSPVVRPPLSTTPHCHARGRDLPNLPPISELIGPVDLPRIDVDVPKYNVNIDEGYEEGYPCSPARQALTSPTSPGTLSAFARGGSTPLPNPEERSRTPAEQDGSWRLGLMRMHRVSNSSAPDWTGTYTMAPVQHNQLDRSPSPSWNSLSRRQ
jgi:hypothetical protein